MPCRDDGYEEEERREKQKRLDLVTRLLCEACAKISEYEMSQELRKWYAAHKEADRKRLAAEERERQRQATKRRAIAKLTPEERKILGV